MFKCDSHVQNRFQNQVNESATELSLGLLRQGRVFGPSLSAGTSIVCSSMPLVRKTRSEAAVGRSTLQGLAFCACSVVRKSWYQGSVSNHLVYPHFCLVILFAFSSVSSPVSSPPLLRIFNVISAQQSDCWYGQEASTSEMTNSCSILVSLSP